MSYTSPTPATTHTIEADILIADQQHIVSPLEWGQDQINALNCTIWDRRMGEIAEQITDPATREMDVVIDCHNPSLFFFSDCQYAIRVVEQALTKVADMESNRIELAPGATAYPFEFRNYSLPVPAGIIVTVAGVGGVAFNTAPDFHKWNESATDPDHRKAYHNIDYNDHTVEALNTITIIILAERQLKAMRLGNMQSKDPIEVAAFYIPHGTKTILLFSAMVEIKYLEELNGPACPWTSRLVVNKTVLPVNNETLAFAVRFSSDVCSRITVVREMNHPQIITRVPRPKRDSNDKRASTMAVGFTLPDQ